MSTEAEQRPIIPQTRTAEDMSSDSLGSVDESVLGNRYRIKRQLGAGTDGIAYAATELAGGSEVEYHQLDKAFSEPERWRELSARLRIVSILDHAASQPIAELLLDQSPPAVACERFPDQALSDCQSLDMPAAVEIAKQLCQAITAGHRLGLYHDDLSPKSVFLTTDNHVRLDFTGLRTGRFHSATGDPSMDRDLRQLGATLQWLLVDRTPLAANAESLNGRDFAALKQLIQASVQIGVAEVSQVADFEQCLDRFRRKLQEAETPPSVATDSPEIDAAFDTIETPVFVETPEERDALADTTDTPVPEPPPQSDSAQPPIDEANTAVDPLDAASVAMQAATKHLPPLAAGNQIGRYKIQRKLGEGGMGAVFQAEDMGSGNTVAIKVLHAAVLTNATAVKRFHKEARMLAKVNNPNVANLLEINEDNGRHFLAIEYVAGTTLKKTIVRREVFPERTALEVAADVARALVDAHEMGVVHRDIKPENIHLNPLEKDSEETRYQVKLLDFGIAREVDQSESMALTQQGIMLGTPLYMSPEQCKGTGEVGPQSDIYSLGITLYEMLTGKPPFTAPDPMKLAAMHCFDSPVEVRKKNSEISEAAAAIVHKAIAKRPQDRHADAAQLLQEIDRLLRGDAASAEVHPILPPHDAKKLFELDLQWDLDSTPEQLWPYVSNTDRLNRAIGLPAATFRTENDPKLGIRKFGSFRLGGMTVAWEEHPFEWVEGRRMGVLREFAKGPFRWFMSIVEMESLASGGTRLHHKVRIAPRNIVGSMLARMEADWKGRGRLERVYRRIDETLTGKNEHTIVSDPFEPPASLPKARHERLQSRTQRLIEHGVSTEVAEKLSDFLATAPAQEVAKIRPIALADQLQIAQNEMIEACFYASVEGLVTLAWDVLCPTCRTPTDAKSTLQELTKHTYCEACDLDFQSNLANSVEMVFRVHPELREADSGQYCIGGPSHAPHVVAQLRLEPGELMELETQLPIGEYLLRGPRMASNVSLHVKESGAPSRAEIELRQDSDPRRGIALRAGKQLLQLENQHDHLQVVRLERTLPRHDLVTAAQASALPIFRKLFPTQVLGVGQLMSAEQVTLLVSEIENIDSLYSELGDADAFSLIQHHLEILEGIVRASGGAVVKIVGEGLEASWHECADAVRAALQMQTALNSDPEAQRIQLSLGVHRGPALVTTVNDRLDYFGATARVAAGLPAHAAGGVAVSQAVYSDPEVSRIIKEFNGTSAIASANLPGAPKSLITRLHLNENKEADA